MIYLIIITLCSAVLSLEIKLSTLAYKIKALLFLNEENQYFKACRRFSTYVKLLGYKATTFLLPVIIPIIVVASIHEFFRTLLDCPYCTAVWVGTIAGMNLVGLPLVEGLMMGLICSLTTRIIAKLI